jgi:hypothetical protein
VPRDPAERRLICRTKIRAPAPSGEAAADAGVRAEDEEQV